MTVEQSRQGALTLSFLAVVSMWAVTGLLTGGEWLLAGTPTDDSTGLALLTIVCALPLLIGVPTLVLSFLLRTLDSSHYGRGGAVRWALLGAGFALWWGVASRLLPETDALVLDRVLRGGLQVGGALWLYWLLFRVLGSPASDGD